MKNNTNGYVPGPVKTKVIGAGGSGVMNEY